MDLGHSTKIDTIAAALEATSKSLELSIIDPQGRRAKRPSDFSSADRAAFGTIQFPDGVNFQDRYERTDAIEAVGAKRETRRARGMAGRA